MTYNKPEIRTLADAMHSIQGGGKPLGTFQDNSVQPPRLNATINAYEADE